MCHHTMWSHCVRVSCFWPCCGLGVWCVVFRGSWAASHASLCRFSGLQSVSRLGFKALETLCSAAGSSGGLGGPSIPLTSRALTSEQGSYSVVEMRTFLLLGTLVLYFYQKNNIPCSCFQHCAPGRFSSSAPSLFSPISVSKQRGRLGKGLDAGTWQTGEAPARLATRGRHQGASSAWKPAAPPPAHPRMLTAPAAAPRCGCCGTPMLSGEAGRPGPAVAMLGACCVIGGPRAMTAGGPLCTVMKSVQVVAAETCSRWGPLSPGSPETGGSPAHGARPGHTVFSLGSRSRQGLTLRLPGRLWELGPQDFPAVCLPFAKAQTAWTHQRARDPGPWLTDALPAREGATWRPGSRRRAPRAPGGR